MELADAILVTKADGENIINAKTSKNNYQNASHLFPKKESNWELKLKHVLELKIKELIKFGRF